MALDAAAGPLGQGTLTNIPRRRRKSHLYPSQVQQSVKALADNDLMGDHEDMGDEYAVVVVIPDHIPDE